jgi:hypothetical protein
LSSLGHWNWISTKKNCVITPDSKWFGSATSQSRTCDEGADCRHLRSLRPSCWSPKSQ